MPSTSRGRLCTSGGVKLAGLPPEFAPDVERASVRQEATGIIGPRVFVGDALSQWLPGSSRLRPTGITSEARNHQ